MKLKTLIKDKEDHIKIAWSFLMWKQNDIPVFMPEDKKIIDQWNTYRNSGKYTNDREKWPPSAKEALAHRTKCLDTYANKLNALKTVLNEHTIEFLCDCFDVEDMKNLDDDKDYYDMNDEGFPVNENDEVIPGYSIDDVKPLEGITYPYVLVAYLTGVDSESFFDTVEVQEFLGVNSLEI